MGLAGGSSRLGSPSPCSQRRWFPADVTRTSDDTSGPGSRGRCWGSIPLQAPKEARFDPRDRARPRTRMEYVVDVPASASMIAIRGVAAMVVCRP